MSRPIDLRSDTVTRPTPEMRRAMAAADVGDDVFGEDPTVRRLEEIAAERLGKEAALFIPSGTMGNVIGVRLHTRPGDVVVAEERSHVVRAERGGAAALSGAMMQTISAPDGVLAPEQIQPWMIAGDLHRSHTALLCVENTHNFCGGVVVPLETMRAYRAITQHAGVAIHLDGARLFNAQIATGVPAREYAAQCDTVTFCLSKGLACPVGSLLCGTARDIGRAQMVRKQLGGGMRQAGILAAAGIVALETMVDRLVEDHRNARRLAQGLAGIPGVSIDLDRVQTNMVFVGLSDAWLGSAAVAALAEQGILCFAMGPRQLRMVCHYEVSADDVERAIEGARRAFAGR